MELENQVCSQELAQKLKELGIEQDSYWWWVEHYVPRLKTRIWEIFEEDENDTVNPHISAFTVAELGELLPSTIENTKWLTIEKTLKETWNVGYSVTKYGFVDGYINESTEANARAKMLIYLLENGLTVTK